MSQRSVYCITQSRGRADRIVHDLKEEDFSSTGISILFLDPSANDERASANGASVAARAVVAQSAPAIRGVMRWIAGIGPVVIPGVGPLIAAGPIGAALSRATVGGVAGGLIDFGVPQLEAKRYEGRIKDGHILISVHTENPEKSDRAREIFVAEGAEDICTMIEVSTPKFLSRTPFDLPRVTAA